MWQGRNLRKWQDFQNEEENRSKRNLSRLIRTVHHIPSQRSRLDTNSLWSLVGELETFSPPLQNKSEHSTNISDRKCYSKKYLNVRLYPSPDISPRRSKSNNKETQNESVIIEKSANSRSNNKPTTTKKIKPQRKKSETYKIQKKTSLENKHFFNEKKRNIENITKKHEIPIKIIQAKKTAKISKTKLQMDYAYNKTKKKENIFKRDESFDDVTLTKSKATHYQDQYDEYVDEKSDDEFLVLDKISVPQFKTSELLLQPIQTTQIVSSNKQMSTDRSSLVKKLTNYWNNILNTELDEVKTSNETIELGSESSTVQCCSRKCLKEIHHVSSNQNIQNYISDSETAMRSRSFSESNVNNLSRHDSISSLVKYKKNQIFVTDSSSVLHLSNKNILEEEHKRKYEQGKHFSRDSNVNITLSNTSSEICCTTTINKSVCAEKHSKAEFDVTTDKTVAVLSQILRQLMSFPNHSILSEQIGLTQPIKTMLCLMTASLYTNYVELEGNEENVQNDKNNSGREVLHKIPEEGEDLTNDLQLENKINLCKTVAVPGITLSQVNKAIHLFTLCKDALWMTFVSNNYGIENCNEFFHDHMSSFSPMFTYIYEEQIVLEGDDSEEEEYKDVKMEDVLSFWNFCSQSLKSFSNTAEIVIDRVLDCTRNCLPDSVESFIRILYQTLASILIWWVILKEIIKK